MMETDDDRPGTPQNKRQNETIHERETSIEPSSSSDESHYDINASEIPENLNRKEESMIFARKAARLFQGLHHFPYKAMLFFTRDSSTRRHSVARYKAMTTQIRLWGAWFNRRWPEEILKGTPLVRHHLTIMQRYEVRKASSPIKRIKQLRNSSRQSGRGRNTISFDRGVDTLRRIFWAQPNFTYQALNEITSTDGAAIFLMGLPALTIDIETWMRLAKYHEATTTPTAIIIFATVKSPLRKTGLGMDVGGGYHAFEFNMNRLGQYLQTHQQAPEPYKALIQAWKDGLTGRKDCSTSTTTLREKEGSRRVIPQSKKGDIFDDEDEEDYEDDVGLTR